MFLHFDPKAAEVPDCTTEQLDSLTRIVAEKQQKLEDDIKSYIRAKQDELCRYERELLEQYRAKGGARSSAGPHETTSSREQTPHAERPHSIPAQLPEPEPAAQQPHKLGPDDAAKRTKHTRVHKREKELCGLVTPIFLPLLDAGGASPVKKKKDKPKQKEGKPEDWLTSPPPEHGSQSPPRDGERKKEGKRSRSRNREDRMDGVEVSAAMDRTERTENLKANQTPPQEPAKPRKRSAIKKSSLRHNGTPRARRKRVSLVIDDQIVHPSDNITDPNPVSPPSESTTSTASASTSSLESTIDPRLIAHDDAPVHHEHHDPMHHSLPRPLTILDPSPVDNTLSASPPPLEYEPPAVAGRSFLESSPPNTEHDMPLTARLDPIYADEPELANEGEEHFSTYVGGIDGSGRDDLDQTGSYGYPSSLGASYLESYMKSRPLKVRMAAAEKAELEDAEKKELIQGKKHHEEDFDVAAGRVEDVDDDMEVIGSMEGF